MKKSILNLGKNLSKTEQQSINGSINEYGECKEKYSFFCGVENHVCCNYMCVLPTHAACNS
ncbi:MULTISPECIES: hypothetical protein [Tenacibaculum]|uniref:Uncharacterized protein n=2 Tax=Tenacibaculum TaxID=104267 RepID=A0A9X4ES64_9FLAO|nr:MULTISPECIES: hypothetical protein [Tenacibaculum]MDE1207255.1 hypothetical protein [Tenacibaculum larymnensis]MDP2541215.1 hypothetical protein [Tenacibaculum discolor]